MLNILYTIIIYPLYQIIEFSYQVGFKIFDNRGLAIICVSLAVTFLCLPLYIVAEKWQHKEHETIRRLKPKINKINAVYKGDERYMILSTYYRQNHYHPLYTLRSSFSVLIQIPFFIAAYMFLSRLDSLKGASFFFIRDLGAPDGLLIIKGIQFNVLPILMTLINFIAGSIYVKNLYIKDKIQVYATAAVFLFLLYNSPSGLALYWTLNNVFSLLKNIFYLLKKPLIVLYITLCSIVIFLDIYLIFFHHGDLYKRITLILISLFIPITPLIIKIYNRTLIVALKPLNENESTRFHLFILSMGILCLLTGFIIPSLVIASSPQEFSYIESTASPFVFLFSSFFQGLGLMIFWPLCVYFMFGNRVKTSLTLLSLFLCYGALLNAFIFPGFYGELTGMLNFVNDGTLIPSAGIASINLLLLTVICGIIFLLISKNKMRYFISVSFIIIIAFICASVINSVTIEREYKRLTVIRVSRGDEEKSSLTPIFHLSKDRKNVILIMLDRGVNSFVPEIFSESPELFEQFSGFTWYPNTLSFNGYTLIGAPPMFGGYEYSPEAINKRTGELLVNKHNESLLLMPVIFSNNEFNVTITDPPWANYSWMPDIRIYSDYPEIKVENTLRTYLSVWLSRKNFLNLQLKSQILKRNFLWFSFFKSAPMVLRPALYNSGKWWNTNSITIDLSLILNNYAVLDLLPDLTDTDSSYNTFLLMVNELTHEPAFLQAPDYVPALNVTDRGTSKYADIINYPANAAALKRLGAWFEYLKQNGVYDNTRIIISADHGADIDSGAFPYSEKIPFRREIYNPLLLVKDFNTDFTLKTDNSFMTNADVPSLAFEDIVQNPINPFTGNPVNVDKKQENLLITTSKKWMPYEHNANTFKIVRNEWYTVHSDIFNADNWQRIEK
jgi:YidC/Oxa1 family membrane protein insertase